MNKLMLRLSAGKEAVEIVAIVDPETSMALAALEVVAVDREMADSDQEVVEKIYFQPISLLTYCVDSSPGDRNYGDRDGGFSRGREEN